MHGRLFYLCSGVVKLYLFDPILITLKMKLCVSRNKVAKTVGIYLKHDERSNFDNDIRTIKHDVKSAHKTSPPSLAHHKQKRSKSKAATHSLLLDTGVQFFLLIKLRTNS